LNGGSITYVVAVMTLRLTECRISEKQVT